MRKFISRVVRKLLVRPAPDPKAELIGMGILKVGDSCELDGMHVFMPDKQRGGANIEIGNNCCIRGAIVVYKKTSKVKIGNNVYIGSDTLLECVEGIEIGDNVLISSHCNIIDTNSHSLHSYERVHDTVDWQKGLAFKNWNVVESKKITIGMNCWLGLRSIVMKGVELAEGTVVAAGSVVTKNTLPFSVVAGNPAKFVKETD